MVICKFCKKYIKFYTQSNCRTYDIVCFCNEKCFQDFMDYQINLKLERTYKLLG